ncbi:MAG: tetratricopeptide repeat protein [Trueperaceae bacterium]
MHLRTLGGAALVGSSFSRPKPLLLLAYLALEGAKSRRFVSELFWGEAARPMNSLRVALSQLRHGAPGALIEEEQRLRCVVPCDALQILQALEAGDVVTAAGNYHGPFLEGFDLSYANASGAAVELEEWVFATREYLAERLRSGLIGLAEAEAALSDFASVARGAQVALTLAGAPPLEPLELERLHRLLVAAGSDRALELERSAHEYGLVLDSNREAARAKLAPDATSRPSAPNNLPFPLTEFVGRDPEQLELTRLLDDPGTRLVTLTGLGGVGKSRLALQLAHSKSRDGSFPDGVYFVALESLTDAALVPAAVGALLPGQPKSLEELAELLREKSVLLVVDNCEHLPGIDRMAATLLAKCRYLKLLATSRDRLLLPAEQLFPLEGLAGVETGGERSEDAQVARMAPPRAASLPESHRQNAPHQDAIRLFVQQGKRARPQFEPSSEEIAHVRVICRLVHGFPLGIELAAARLRLMSTEEIAREMEVGLDFLEGASGAIAKRHGGMRSTFEHSWRLLEPPEQVVLRKLSIFTGGFSREAASRVVGATIPLLATLVDKSLLRTTELGRFDRHPLIHQYTAEKLAEHPAELAEARDAHARWFVALAEEADAHSSGEAQGVWLERLQSEQYNLRAALEWTLAHEVEHHRSMLGLRLAVALYRFWYYRSHLAEGRHWLRLAIERSESLGSESLGSESLGEEAIPLRSKALHAAGVLADEQGDVQAASELFEARLTLARELGDVFGQAATLNSLGVVALAKREYSRARDYLEQSLELRERLGRKELLDTPRVNLGLVALAQEDYPRAQSEFEYSLALSREFGSDMGCAIALTNLGAVWVDREMPESAQKALAEASELYRSLGNKDGLGHCLDGFAAVATLQGRHEFGARLAGAAASLLESIGAASGAVDKTRVERRLAAAREALGTQGFEASWRKGYEQGYEELLNEALGAREYRGPQV